MGNFLIGFGIGVTLGVLLAPKSGSETRQFLVDSANEGSDYLMRQGQQLKDTASDLIDRGRGMVTAQKEKLADAVSNVAGQAQRHYQNQV